MRDRRAFAIDKRSAPGPGSPRDVSASVAQEAGVKVKRPRRRYNPKRAISEGLAEVDRQRLREKVEYGGNPEHKRNPGDFDLNPPASPRPDKTLCDEVEIFSRDSALELLRRGIDRGLVSQVAAGGWPQNIWSVTENGHPMEAQLENRDKGTYHGYPMPEGDAFRDVVLDRWHREDDDR